MGFSSVQFSRSVVSDSLRPHELQHARPPCPSPPGASGASREETGQPISKGMARICPSSWACRTLRGCLHPAVPLGPSSLQAYPPTGGQRKAEPPVAVPCQTSHSGNGEQARVGRSPGRAGALPYLPTSCRQHEAVALVGPTPKPGPSPFISCPLASATWG